MEIATIVFFDLETTGLPKEEHNKTNIIELSLVAVRRKHLCETKAGEVPRVQHKLTLCFTPKKLISPSSSEITGLTNELLEYEPKFSHNTFHIINSFINEFRKPICFVAHNGLKFDYPILKRILIDLNCSFSDSLMCADSLLCFQDILEDFLYKPVKKFKPRKRKSSTSDSSEDYNQELNEIVDLTEIIVSSADSFNRIQAENETTPVRRPRLLALTPKKKSTSHTKGDMKARKCLPWSKGKGTSYRLTDVYERLLNRPANNNHRAECDCIILMECCVVMSDKFVKWLDTHCVKFNEINPMEIAPLLLVSLIWGVTNPFLKRGTHGVRNVKSTSKLTLVFHEIIFLLSNWKYVIPFLINQIGSVLYFFTLQKSQLSLAVPITNALTFVVTALAGSILGEEPLNKQGVFGIVLIISGTTLCCMDKL